MKFAIRQESINSADNGWRVFSEFDSEDYVNDPSNMRAADYNDVCELEPAMIAVWSMPVGTDIEIIRDANGRTRVYVRNTDSYLDSADEGKV